MQTSGEEKKKKKKKSQRGCWMGSCMSLPVTKIVEERQRWRPTHDQIKAMLSSGQPKGKKGSVLSGNDGYNGEGYGWKSFKTVFAVVTGNWNPGGGKHLHNTMWTELQTGPHNDEHFVCSHNLASFFFFFGHFILWNDCMPLVNSKNGMSFC